MATWEEQIINGLPPADKCLLISICRNMTVSSSPWISLNQIKEEYDNIQATTNTYPPWNRGRIQHQIATLNEFGYIQIRGNRPSTLRVTLNTGVLSCEAVEACLVDNRTTKNE